MTLTHPTPGFLQEFEKSIRPFKRLLSQASQIILDQDVSNYPIFVVHFAEITIGIPLLQDLAAHDLPYFVYASTLEELATKNIIAMENVSNFRDVYKNPKTHLCVLCLLEHAPSIVFLPLKAEEGEMEG